MRKVEGRPQICSKPSRLPEETTDQTKSRWRQHIAEKIRKDLAFLRAVQTLLTEVGDGSEDGDGEDVPDDAEHNLVDPNVEGHLGDDVIPAVDQLHRHHRPMSSPRCTLPSPAAATAAQRPHGRRRRSAAQIQDPAPPRILHSAPFPSLQPLTTPPPTLNSEAAAAVPGQRRGSHNWRTMAILFISCFLGNEQKGMMYYLKFTNGPWAGPETYPTRADHQTSPWSMGRGPWPGPGLQVEPPPIKQSPSSSLRRSIRRPSRSAAEEGKGREGKGREGKWWGRGVPTGGMEDDGEPGGPRLSKRFAGGKLGSGEVDFKTKAGTAWSHSFLNQKPWHPLSYPNQRRKWIAEQSHAQRERRAEEVSREVCEETWPAVLFSSLSFFFAMCPSASSSSRIPDRSTFPWFAVRTGAGILPADCPTL